MNRERGGYSTAQTKLALLLLAAFLSLGSIGHAAALGLYEARAVVTGQGEPNRRIGFALALENVLVKVSGDPRLIGDGRVAALAKDAGALVAGFGYRDRLEGVPVHDEQGTYDRPHDLTVSFDPAKIDAALRGLGRKPWMASRPRLAVFLGVSRYGTSYTLLRDGERDADMRFSLNAAAMQMGFETALPDAAGLDGAGLDAGSLPEKSPAALSGAAKALGGELALVGSLVWSDAAHGWIADWRLDAGGRPVHWQARGVSFDDAFRNGIRGAAQVLSGNGQPG